MCTTNINTTTQPMTLRKACSDRPSAIAPASIPAATHGIREKSFRASAFTPEQDRKNIRSAKDRQRPSGCVTRVADSEHY
jgi:hypothetical protein